MQRLMIYIVLYLGKPIQTANQVVHLCIIFKNTLAIH